MSGAVEGPHPATVDTDVETGKVLAEVETAGLSPKVVYAAVSALVAYVAAQVGLELPDYVTAAIVVLAVAAATWLAKPGRVKLK